MTRCLSIKSKKDLFSQCNLLKCADGDFCKKHSTQKQITLYNPNLLNPLNSLNDIDPLTFDKIYYEENNKRHMCRGIKISHLFTYKLNINDKFYQRTLTAESIKNIIDKGKLIDPFSQVEFPEEIINNAKSFLAKLKFKVAKLSPKMEQKLLIMNLIDFFAELGFIIHVDWIEKLKKNHFICWNNEITHLWNNLRKDNLPLTQLIYYQPNLPHYDYEKKDYIKNLLSFFIDLSKTHVMGCMIVLSALSWISKDVKNAYPDLIISI
jgi:hypothetical protein